MAKTLKDIPLEGPEYDIYASQFWKLNQELRSLAEDYAKFHGSYSKGLAEMGEHLLQYADFLHHYRDGTEDISWLGLMQELMRRSG